MVLEPVCCGLPVITTDAAPMNEYVCQPEIELNRGFSGKILCISISENKSRTLTPTKHKKPSKKIEWCARTILMKSHRVIGT